MIYKLIGAAVFLVVITIAFLGAKRSYDNEIRASERAKYSALIGKCEESKRKPAECAKEWTDAVEFNVSLQKDLADLRKASQSCSTKTKEGADLTVKSEAEKERRLAKSEGYRDGLKQSRAELESRLAAATGPAKTCEQTLTSVGVALKSVALQRIRFALGFDDAPVPNSEGVIIK